MKNDFYELQNLVYIDKNYDSAICLINDNFCNNVAVKNLLADLYFRQFNFKKCIEIYLELNEFYKAGYCHLMMNDMHSAKIFFQQAEDSPAKNWALFFCELFDKEVKHFPTYLQIRMFLERDLNLILKLALTEYVQKLADISDYLCDINPETNKFFAKAFLYNEYTEYTLIFLNRGLEYTTKDAEIYYLLGVCSLKDNKISDAKKYLKNAINVNKNYFPATMLLDSCK